MFILKQKILLTLISFILMVSFAGWLNIMQKKNKVTREHDQFESVFTSLYNDYNESEKDLFRPREYIRIRGPF